MKAFGSKELEKCVEKLGFTFNSISSSHHAKYNPPKGINIPVGNYPFFQFQLGRKAYDPHSANRYITQLKKFGFSKEQIEKNLK